MKQILNVLPMPIGAELIINGLKKFYEENIFFSISN
jgi:hypothetical protein